MEESVQSLVANNKEEQIRQLKDTIQELQSRMEELEQRNARDHQAGANKQEENSKQLRMLAKQLQELEQKTDRDHQAGTKQEDRLRKVERELESAKQRSRRKYQSGSDKQNFFSKHKHALESRLSSVLTPIVALLYQEEVLNDCERQDVGNRASGLQTNYFLLNMIEKKGTRAQEAFYDVLKKADPFLVDELESKCH
ncbi:cingulin-like [Sardina pilchardus]|uniref:cingulin-like n=1 Tax=Sardina pilchardus TaxID=27697 RepID=UPI002E10019E